MTYILSNQFIEQLILSVFVYGLTMIVFSFCVGYVVESNSGFLFVNWWRRFLFLLLRSFILRMSINAVVILMGDKSFSTPVSIAMEGVYTVLITVWAFGFENKDFQRTGKFKRDYCNYKKIFHKQQIKMLPIIIIILIASIVGGIYLSTVQQSNYDYVIEKYNNVDMMLLQNDLYLKNSISHLLVSWGIGSVCGFFLLHGLKFVLKEKEDHNQGITILVIGRLFLMGFCCFVMIVATAIFQFCYFGRKTINFGSSDYTTGRKTSISLGVDYKYSEFGYDNVNFTKNIKIKTYTYKKEKAKNLPFNPFVNIKDKSLGTFVFDYFTTESSKFHILLQTHNYPELSFDNQVVERYVVSYIDEEGTPRTIKANDIDKQKEDKNLTILLERAVKEGYFEYIEFGSKYMIKYNEDFILPILKEFQNGKVSSIQAEANNSTKKEYMIEFCNNLLINYN